MSRIGKAPIPVPGGVNIKIDGRDVTVKGPKGELKYQMPENFKLEINDGIINVYRPSEAKKDKALHGLVRSLVKNMVTGVSVGFTKTLEVIGVGYKVQMQGSGIKINVGYSHPIVLEPESGIEFDSPNANTIIVKGIDKYKVGQVAADIRAIRPPEPYKGKGIKYSDEVIRQKVGKAGA